MNLSRPRLTLRPRGHTSGDGRSPAGAAPGFAGTSYSSPSSSSRRPYCSSPCRTRASFASSSSFGLAQVAPRALSVEGIRFAGFLALLTVLAGGTAVAAVERPKQNLSPWDDVWWAVMTRSRQT
jgi:hypothetical protein